MTYVRNYFDFFSNIIQSANGEFGELYLRYLWSLPEEEISSLKPNKTTGIGYIHNKAYDEFAEYAFKSDKFKSFVFNYVNEQKEGLKRQIINYLVGKELDRRIDYLTLTLKDIHNYISICNICTNVANIDECIVSSLKEIGQHFLDQYRDDFNSETVQFLSNSFINEKKYYDNGHNALSHNENTERITESKNTQSRPLPEKVTLTKKLQHYTLKPNPKYKNKEDRYGQIDDLYDKLGRYVRCNKKVFRSVFGYGSRVEVVEWVADINQLYYLVNVLIKKEFIVGTRKWQVTVACFRLTEGELTPKRLRWTSDPVERSIIDIATNHL